MNSLDRTCYDCPSLHKIMCSWNCYKLSMCVQVTLTLPIHEGRLKESDDQEVVTREWIIEISIVGSKLWVYAKFWRVFVTAKTQPLLLPTSTWINVSLDFIACLPKSGNKSFIMVVVDRHSKYAHYCALLDPFTLIMVAQVFMDQIFKLHGMPTSIMFD